MDWRSLINESALAVTLVAAIAAIVVLVIVSGPDSLAPTGFHDLVILLAGALAGATVKSGTSKKDPPSSG